MMNSALARTMQIQRTTETKKFAKRSRRSRMFTASPLRRQGRRIPAAPKRRAPALTSEVLLAVEDKGDGLFHAEPLALFGHQPRHGLDEWRLVGGHDLGELALEFLEVLDLGDVPRATHVGL